MIKVLDRPPFPKLLKIRWVCDTCLNVIFERLKVSWTWESDHTGKNRQGHWSPTAVEGPICHGVPMLMLGEPKTDIHGLRGYGLIIDPFDDMRPRLLAKVA